MKKRTTLLKNTMLAMGLTFMVQGAMAQTFTAVTSGNWTSEATWGGETPGNLLTTEDVEIPDGITVFLDTDVEVNGLFASIDVDGTLEATGSDELIVSSGDLEGDGNLDLDYLEIGTLGTMTFVGDAEIEKMVNTSASLILSSTVNIADTLSLMSGNILLGGGSSLGMNSESVIKVDEGSVTIGGGLFSSDNPYTLVYVGDEKNVGIEANGGGLTDLYVQLDDADAAIMLSGDVNVSGDLFQENGDIDLDGGDLMIGGDYVANAGAEIIGDENSDLMINSTSSLTSSITFQEGDEMVDNLMLIGDGDVDVSFDSDVMIMGDLSIEDAVLMIEGDNTLMISEGSTITINDSDLMFEDGADFDGTAEYNVEYMGGTTESGLELGGSGLNDLSITLDNEDDEVMLTADVEVDGMLNLNGGDLDLNGSDLMIMGDFQGTGNAEIQGDSESGIWIMTDGSLSDTLFFDADEDELNTLMLDLEGSGDVILGSDLMVENLEMEEGMLILIDGDLEVASTGTLSGTDGDNFISTQGSGSLWLTVNVDAPYMIYPVGNEDGFSPAWVQIENGTAGSFGVNVMKGVFTDGTIGTDVSASESVVDRTWNVTEGTGSSTDINLTLSWSSSMELNGFNNEEAFITHYAEGNWDVSAFTSATFNEETDMFEMERQEITSLSPFAVKDDNSQLSIEEVTTVEFNAYPNPATDVVYLDLTNLDGDVDYKLINNQGQIVTNYRTQQAGSIITFDLSDLQSGMYFIQVIDGENVTAERIIKK